MRKEPKLFTYKVAIYEDKETKIIVDGTVKGEYIHIKDGAYYLIGNTLIVTKLQAKSLIKGLTQVLEELEK